MPKPTPPQLSGLPIIGNALEFRKDFMGLVRRGYEKFGPVFTIQLGRQPAVVLVGPEYHEFFFNETDNILSMKEVYRFLKPMFGEKIFFAAGPKAYQEQRPIILPAFHGRKMPGYIKVMVRETQDWLATLGEEGEFELVSTFETLTMHIAAHAFLGPDFRYRMSDEFWNLYRDLAQGIDFILPPNLPIPRFIRRDRARKKMRALLEAVIADRRKNSQDHNDFLRVFIDANYEDGRPVEDELIVSLILGMVFAGHETTAGHASWALVQLLQHPNYLGKLVAELDAVLPPGEPMDRAHLRELNLLEWALKETERLEPVASQLMRYNAQSYEIDGYHVPEGWLTIIATKLSHRLPEIFQNPETYDPFRFAPGREEDRAHRHALAGFGGGTHKCTGKTFAYTEMKVIFSLLLQSFELRLIDPDPQPSSSITSHRPQRPCMLHYKQRETCDQVNPVSTEENTDCLHQV